MFDNLQHAEDGSIVVFTLLFVVALLALIGLVVDGGRAIAAKESAMAETEQAARVGADMLSRSALYDGWIKDNYAQAIDAAEIYMLHSGHPGTASVYGGTVVAAIDPYNMPTTFLAIIGIKSLSISAVSSVTNIAGP